MGQQEVDLGVAGRELGELDGVRGLLPRVFPPAVLPDVVQHRDAPLGRHLADRIEQRIGGPAACGELDADHAGIEAALELGLGVGAKVGIDDAVAADAGRVSPLQREQAVVAVLDVGGRGKVDRRRQPQLPRIDAT